MNNTPDDRDLDGLRGLLQHAAPEAADLAGLPSIVRRRARHGTLMRGASGSAALALTAVAVVFAPHYLTSGSDAGAARGDSTVSPTGRLEVATIAPCAMHGATPPVKPMQDGRIPPGALRAWVCAVSKDGVRTLAAPREELTRDVDQLAAVFNRASPVRPPYFCTERVKPIRYTLTFAYAGRSRLTVHGRLDICNWATVEGRPRVTRTAGRQVLREFGVLLQSQRRNEAPFVGSPAQAPRCPMTANSALPSLMPDGPRLGLVAARYCRYPASFTDEKSRAIRLTSAQVAQLDAGFAKHATTTGPPGSGCVPARPLFGIIAVTAYGDLVWLSVGDCTFSLVRSQVAGPAWFWSPTGSLRDFIVAQQAAG